MSRDTTKYALAALTTTCNSTTSQTVAVPAKAAAFLISVSTTDAIVTFDGSAPSSTNGVTFPKGQAPVVVPVSGQTLTCLAAAAGNSIVNVVPLQG